MGNASKLIALCILFAFSIAATAAVNIEIPTDNVKVYSRSDIASPVIGILHKGAVVPSANNLIGNFRKVLIVVNGQKKIGYISMYDIKGPLKIMPFVQTAKGPRPPQRMIRRRVIYRKPFQGLHKKKFVALMGGLEYESQGARTYTDSTGAPINVGTLTGTMAQFGIEIGLPISYNFTLVPYLFYKPVSVTGTASPQGGATTASDIILQQTFITLGALAKIYPRNTSNWWWGGGLQLDHGSSGSLQIGTAAPIASAASDLPNFVMVYAATGYDIGLSDKLFIIPDIRAGALVNTTPPIIEVDANLSIALAF